MAWNDLVANQFVDFTSAETSPFTKIRPLPVGSMQFMTKNDCIYYFNIQQPTEFQALASGQWVEKRLLLAPAAVLPTVTTTSVSSITAISAVSGGNVTSDGGATVTERGICWAMHNLPDITDFKMANGSGLGSYIGNLAGLIQLTPYYVRAYATNSAGTAYGAAMYFTTVNLCTMPLGTYYGGGRTVYYLVPGNPGYDVNVCHGLIMGDDIGAFNWNGYYHSTGTSLAIGYGQQNTNTILASLPITANTAARACNETLLNGYSDWYLPSVNELSKIYSIIPADTGWYWSSSEDINNTSMAYYTHNNSQYLNGKASLYNVRPFRSF
jgi:hypothetical protein